ncbi:MAG: helix-turn-helix domain-containing protein [Patescibacteria group bacterium]
MQLEEQLKDLQLTKSETKVYLHLLEQGLSTPPQIARGTGIARTNCYNILSELKNSSLIEEQEKGKRRAYIASDPEALLRAIQKKKEAVERLLPDLRALYTVQKNKPKIRFYDGFEQVKEIYWQATNTEKLLALGSTKHLAERDPKFFTAWEREMQRKQVVLQDLITNPSQTVGVNETQEMLKGLYDFRTLPEKYRDFPTDILVWNNNIALITLKEPIFGTMITSDLLAQTFRYVLEMVWEGVARRS